MSDLNDEKESDFSRAVKMKFNREFVTGSNKHVGNNVGMKKNTNNQDKT